MEDTTKTKNTPPPQEMMIGTPDEQFAPPEEKQLLPPEELNKRMYSFFNRYYLAGARRDRDSYYALTPEDFKAYPLCLCGLFVNLIMDGQLDKAGEILQNFDENNMARIGLELSYPKLTARRLFEIVNHMKAIGMNIPTIQITAGRPSVLNGVLDYTRLGPFLEGRKDEFLEGMQLMYDGTIVPALYNLCLAEWQYQQNRLMDAGLLVSKTIKEFDNDQQRRLLFVALYLQAKVLLASGKVSNMEGYIKNIRRFAKETGELEFSANINAAEAYTFLYSGNHEALDGWLASDAPDELEDFNMLDLYRYMVKIRCYIVKSKPMAVQALAERLRPLLEEGMRYMDLCELDLLLAICFFRADEKQHAFHTLESVIRTAKRRGYYRLVADEGAALLPLLVEYIKERGETPFLMRLAEDVRDMASWYPLYLKPARKDDVEFSKIELNLLKFLEQGKSKEEIADYFFVSVNTVKFHMKNIYKKLDVTTVHQAVWEARLMGVI
ncbi:MAG: LuxR C-terminal-related transcriptional regulator [Treponema sp.]|nr:LuxR C-terminal-related transcriptional regulator [Treponema sp.]